MYVQLRKYALSDPKEPAFQSPCDHEHTEVCDRCELLKTSIQAIEAGLVAQNDNLTPEVKEELSFTVKQAKTAILAWKSHLLRSVNQDAARLEVLDSLDESSVLLVQDWAISACLENIARANLTGTANVAFRGILL